MAEVYLASSALIQDGYDGLRTIEEAQKFGFDGVQLFLDIKYREDVYLSRVIKELAYSQLGLVVHLPNKISVDDIRPTEQLVKEIPDVKILIHFFPTTVLPEIKGAVVGWENSFTGFYNPEHIKRVRERVRNDGTFFVFDAGRSLYASNVSEQGEVVRFTKATIAEMNPRADIIHVADKTSWTGEFRDTMCTLGEGVCSLFVDDIRRFGGTVVLEHEDLRMAVDSLKVLR